MKEKLKNPRYLFDKFLNFMLLFWVSYGVLQSTSISLEIKNYLIIAVLFILLCIKIFFHVFGKEKLSLLPKKGTVTIWSYIKPIDYIVLAFLAINSIWILIVPQFNGFSLFDAISEAGMLVSFVLYFPLAVLVRMNEIDFKKIIKTFYYSTLVLAVIHVIFWTCEAIHKGSINGIFAFLDGLPFFRTGGVATGWGIVRFTISNSILLGAGLLLHFAEKKPLNIFSIIQIILFSYAILGTYLKSLWFGVIAGMAVMVVYGVTLIISKKRKENKQNIKNTLISGITITAAILILSSTVFQGSALNRFVNSFINTDGVTNIENNVDPEDAASVFDQDQDTIGAIYSNNIKIEQMGKLTERWLEQPLFGFGYGSSVPGYYRSETQHFSYEMTAFALLMKIGIIGVISWLAIAVGAAVIVIKHNRKKPRNIAIWIAVTFSFLVSIQTNPLLFTANAINLIILLLLFGVKSSVESKDVEAEK